MPVTPTQLSKSRKKPIVVRVLRSLPIARKTCVLNAVNDTLDYLPGFDFQMYAFLRLQITDQRKQVAWLGGPAGRA
jgi:hypothetical protein